jgi:hypothetical protein
MPGAARHHAEEPLHHSERNGRHIADQAVTLPTKTSIPVCLTAGSTTVNT